MDKMPKELVRGPNGKLVEGKAPAPTAPKQNPIYEALTRPHYNEAYKARRRSKVQK